ncbi:PDZ domain-containing protein [Desulfurobacterium thermolithotrophum]|uniref:PDZ domain-containing protein n=1 Tax=Desulfurobacterium thermolithotrophum TaxID=64160 RepID=UPI0013D47505|nr:PDZ domain-containing protein [Desulfurobacterium thermolithotrophum]
MLKDKLNFGLNIFSVLLLSYSITLFLSSIFLLKLKPCFNADLSFKPQFKASALPFPFLEREGFFKSPIKLEEKTIAPEKREVINLEDFTLKGTIICSQCSHSIVILKDKKTGKTLAVSEGKEIKGFKVLKIYSDYVILKKDGKEYILKLFEKENKNSLSRLNTGSKNFFQVKRKDIMNEIASGNFLRYINIVPNINPEGLKVNYVNRKSFIYKLGIKPGDVITSINDIHIKTPEDSFSAFEQLKNSDSITITVVRNGREVKLHYELE